MTRFEKMKVKGDEYELVEYNPTMRSNVKLEPFIDPFAGLGVALNKVCSPDDDSYGVHYTKYGGIGAATINGGRGVRSQQHFRTGVDPEIPQPVPDWFRNVLVKRNKNFYSQSINECANDIFNAVQSVKTTPSAPKVKKSLFPRSETYELEYVRARYHERMLIALEKERTQFEEEMNRAKTQMAQNKEEETPDPEPDTGRNDEAWKPKPPFWYDSENRAEKPRETNIDEYTITSVHQPPDRKTLLEEMSLESPQRYIPGEIYKSAKPPIETLGGNEKLSGVWQPRDPKFHQPFDPTTVPQSRDLQEDVARRERAPSCLLPSATSSTEGEDTLTPEATAMAGKKAAKEQVIDGFSAASENVTNVQEEIETAECDGKKTWPKPPRYLESWGSERASEFFLTGIPFKTEAARWYECNYSPFDISKTSRPGKKIFPELKFSNI